MDLFSLTLHIIIHYLTIRISYIMRILLTIITSILAVAAWAQNVSVKWELSDKDNLSKTEVVGDASDVALLTYKYTAGSAIAGTATLTGSGAETGYTAVPYDPNFTSFQVTTKKTAKTSGHSLTFTVTPQSGHKFKPTSISFDACKVGTDGGNVDVYVKAASNAEVALGTGLSPLRNKISATNSTGFTHYEYVVNDYLLNGQPFQVILYLYNINGTDTTTPKAIGFRNVTVNGAVDEEIFTASKFVSSFSCKTAQGESISLINDVKDLRNGGLKTYGTKLYGEPTDFRVVCTNGYTATVDYVGNTATVKIFKGSEQVFYYEVRFVVSNRSLYKPMATPLKRGLMALSLSGANMGSGNLVSWRHRESDDQGVKYKLYRGTSAASQTTRLNSGKYIIDKTNFIDTSGSKSSYYKLEVYDKYGVLLETEVSKKTWENQTFNIPISAPIDTKNGATYSANDASFCDMDGDGEYEVVLKWSPSNEKDAASTGTTSNPIFDCYKMDGTRLWRIDLGPNFFVSAHTIQFIAWDFDGDGYGEFMCKTGPGTVDGEGNYVLLNGDSPYTNWKNGRGKQVEGPEYITVFDGTTGAEISTIPYHTNYAAGASYWGDSDQNRSERYLAALAYLDGYDKNPSPIFARGYYKGAFVGAYDFDGVELKERWVSRNTTSGKNLWGEGAHWISVGDCDGDGKQEIVYGSAALDHDGSLLYRTGLGHGDALHLGDFITDHEGLEVFMVHEEKPYGYDIRDAKTGEFIHHVTASGDTGRGLAAHFDSSEPSAQFLYSASGYMFNCDTGEQNGSNEWKIGNSGAGINFRVYWDGDLYDEFYDKSIIAHWNPTNKWFDRYKVNNGNYTWGSLNNGSKNNPCVSGDILGDWREEIITHDDNNLIINATSFASDYRIPHLMDDPQYRVQVVNQNCTYNQPPHLSYDPAVKYKGNPNVAQQTDLLMPGDVNGDKVVDMRDAVELISHCVSGTTASLNTEKCDVDKNGAINASDAIAIMNIYLKNK